MIKLYQFPSLGELSNYSPFCMKVETYLRMTKTPFEVIKSRNPHKAPKGKLPFIEDNGVRIADSSLIIDYLKAKNGDTLDAGLSRLHKAQALALQRLMEEHLYWCYIYARWIDDANWPKTKKIFFGKVPFILRGLLSGYVRHGVKSESHSHGMGRHTTEEIYAMGVNDLEALSVTLGDNKFLMGNEPRSIDACAYAFIANAVKSPVESPMTSYANSQMNFVAYCERMKTLFY